MDTNWHAGDLVDRRPQGSIGDMVKAQEPAPDPHIMLLHALAWVCAEPARADRLLALTGMDAAQLRARADDPAVLMAIGNFLCAHEADLLDCAQALSLPPEQLAAAGEKLAMQGQIG